ncbi:MAG TPA: CocE/NonD family hydrolase [Candidatus Thermoplasmatota archaeon]|nr:CocE/NonD family hydrolase [Candidatus Thermoplasmatota archaeon]
MSQRTLAVLALVALVAAGCVGPTETVAPADTQSSLDRAGLSVERFLALPGQSLWIPASSDGTELHVRLFLPDLSSDSDWRAPTLLVMSPYFAPASREDPDDTASPPGYFRYKWLLENFVPRGYAVVFADVRGTGESGGCLEQTATLQSQDGYDLVEWIAAQPWSNGRVGMFGKSYDGETQQATATLAPPHLTTIVPVSSVSGQYEWNFYDGVPYTLHNFFGNFFYGTGEGMDPPSSVQGWRNYGSRPLCQPEMFVHGLDTSGDWDEYWEVREFRKRADDVRASVLYVHGLQDWNVKPVAIRDWFDRIPSEKRAVLGQWAHDYPEENRFRPEWSRPDWRELVHRWYDHWLLGLDNGILDDLPPVQVQDSSGTWRREAAFPPADAASFALHFAPGALVLEPPPAFEPLFFRENIEAFARSAGAPVPTVPPPVAPPNEALVFESDPLSQTIHVSGWPTVTFRFTVVDSLTGGTDPHFAFVLYDVSPDGKAQWINRGYLSARHRDGVENPKPTPMREPIDYTVRFFPADTVVEAGNRLRLVLSGSDGWTQPEGSFWAGVVESGTLSLPVVERDWNAVRLPVEFGEPVKS